MENRKEKPKFYDVVTQHLKSQKNSLGDDFKSFEIEKLMENHTDDDLLDMLTTFGSMSFIYGNMNEMLRNKAMGLTIEDSKLTQTFKNPLKDRLKVCGFNDLSIANTFSASILKITKDIRIVRDEDGEIIEFDNKDNKNPTTEKFFETLQKAKNLILGKINSKITDNDTIANISAIINSDTFSIAVEMGESLMLIKDKINNDELTYHDLILVNSFIFEQFTITNIAEFQPLVSKLYSEDCKFQTELEIAMEHYEKQKYAIIFYDSLVGLMETISIFDDADQLKISKINDEKCSGFDIKNKKININNDTVDAPDVVDDPKVKEDHTIKKNSFDYSEYNVSPKDSIHIYLYKTLFNIGLSQVSTNLNALDENDIKDTVNSIIIDGIKVVYDSEHKQELQNVLMNAFKVKPNLIEINRWSNVGELLDIISSGIKELNNDYTDDAKVYMGNIDENIKDELVLNINNLLSKIIIPNDAAEIKGIVFEQFNENKIHTYKQLNQFIEIIEKCNIPNNAMSDFIKYNTFLKNEDNKIIDKLKLSISLHGQQDKISYFILFQKYFKMFTLNK